MPLPSPEEFVEHTYSPDGQCFDCPGSPPEAAQWAAAALEMTRAPEIGGALQIKSFLEAVPGAQVPPTVQACLDTVNGLALSDPSWSHKIGQKGLMRLYSACYYEAVGDAPAGYMQQVANVLSKGSGIPTWMWWAAAGLGAWALLRR